MWFGFLLWIYFISLLRYIRIYRCLLSTDNCIWKLMLHNNFFLKDIVLQSPVSSKFVFAAAIFYVHFDELRYHIILISSRFVLRSVSYTRVWRGCSVRTSIVSQRRSRSIYVRRQASAAHTDALALCYHKRSLLCQLVPSSVNAVSG